MRLGTPFRGTPSIPVRCPLHAREWYPMLEIRRLICTPKCMQRLNDPIGGLTPTCGTNPLKCGLGEHRGFSEFSGDSDHRDNVHSADGALFMVNNRFITVAHHSGASGPISSVGRSGLSPTVNIAVSTCQKQYTSDIHVL